FCRRRRLAEGQGRAVARQPERRHRRGHAPPRPAGLQRAVPPGGVARAARRRVPVRPLHPHDRRAEVMLSEVLDRLIAFAARDEAELVRGREEWAESAGRVFDDDPLYEERAVAFLEWFSLERPGPDGRVPAARFLAEEPLADLEGRWAEA